MRGWWRGCGIRVEVHKRCLKGATCVARQIQSIYLLVRVDLDLRDERMNGCACLHHRRAGLEGLREFSDLCVGRGAEVLGVARIGGAGLFATSASRICRRRLRSTRAARSSPTSARSLSDSRATVVLIRLFRSASSRLRSGWALEAARP
jgi:hypothetical protein